jgi:FixJ family two-component response regulator
MNSNTSRGTIAIVEDDAGVRTALEQLLRSAGFKAVTYGSAEEFLEGGRSGRVDCLIADVNLPGMSGVALVQTLAKESGGPPVVIMTGRDDPTTVELIRQAGRVPCLRKPFSEDALFKAIATALAA